MSEALGTVFMAMIAVSVFGLAVYLAWKLVGDLSDLKDILGG